MKTSDRPASPGGAPARRLGCSLFLMLCVLLISGSGSARSQSSTPFNFSLDNTYTTSAAVYDSGGTLVKNLWSKVVYGPGPHSAVWDGTDNRHAAVPAGTYQIRVLTHNLQYVWDGYIGNTSTERSGPSVFQAFKHMRALCISGTSAYYLTAYNEAHYDFHEFQTTDTGHVTANFSTRLSGGSAVNTVGGTDDDDWKFTDTDGTRVYFASSSAWNSGNQTPGNKTQAGFVVAYAVGSNSVASFSNGTQIAAEQGHPYPNGLYVGTQPGLSGLAVQRGGNILAVAVAPDNKVYLFDKTSGSALGSIPVSAPGGLAMAASGDLWVITGTSVVRYTNLSGTPSIAATISGLSQPLAVAVSPADGSVLVADGDGSEQLKDYPAAGGTATNWTYGQLGGYASGPQVANDKFWFRTDAAADGTYLAFQPDGSFWVGDEGNLRNLHFSASRALLGQIMWLTGGELGSPGSYIACADVNNPTRVFNQFLEFQVDYTKPLGQSWTLVNNWAASLAGQSQYFADPVGLQNVYTLSNGRTYGVLSNTIYHRQVVELVTGQGVRITPAQLDQGFTYFAPDGSLTVQSGPNSGVVSWNRQTLSGFDGSGNPQWNAPATLASATGGGGDPYWGGGGDGNPCYPVTSSGVLICYAPGPTSGNHLGGVVAGSGQWLWEGMPTVSSLLASDLPENGLGLFDIGDGVIRPGNEVVSAGRHVVAGYNGENWQQSQANQWMHFYDDGLFFGEFGEPGAPLHPKYEGVIAEFAGNDYTPTLVTVSGEIYLWHNDESATGVHRWHLVGAGTAQELTGSGVPGSTLTLAAPAAPFPTGLKATAGSAQVSLSWLAPTAGAAGYNVKASTTNGGPYTTVATGVTSTTASVTGLTNAVPYYFVVSAVSGSGAESVNSDPAKSTPYDPTALVLAAGQTYFGNIEPFPVTSANPALGLPAITNLKNWGGSLTLNSVGGKGYVIYNWGGAGSDKANVLSPFSVTTGAGWITQNYLNCDFPVDGAAQTLTPGDAYHYTGLGASPAGTININVSDSATHYLTVFSGMVFQNAAQYTVKLTPQGQSSPVASYTVNDLYGGGFNRIFQFQFKGNVTLTVDNTGGSGGTVSALFLDNADVQAAPPPPPAPTNLTAAAGSGQVSLSWTASAGATSYSLYRGSSAGGEINTPVATNITATTFLDTGRVNGTAYYYKVKAVNVNGTSGYSNEASATPVAGGGTPTVYEAESGTLTGGAYVASDAAASNGKKVVLTGASGDSCTVTGVNGGPGGSAPVVIHYATSGASPVKTLLVNGVSVGTVTFSNTNGWSTFADVSVTVTLGGGSANTVGIQSNGDGLGVMLDKFTVTPAGGAAPPAPTNLTVTAGNSQISLNWTASAGATSYSLYRGSSAGGESSTPVATGITGTTYTNTGLTNGTAYYYKAKAVNSGGTSGYSNEASGTPAATTTVYEAESGAFGGGAASYADAAASGGYKVALPGNGTAYDTVSSVSGGAGGTATLVIHYSAVGANPVETLLVNGVAAGTLTFPVTSTWSTFADLTTTVTLGSGAGNTIKLLCPASNAYGLQADKFTVTR